MLDVMTQAPAVERIVGSKAGQIPWAREALIVLRETAARYGATVTYADLAEAVQHRSGIRTHAQQRTWLAGVLKLVATACHGRGLPPLTSLAVNPSDGRVGPAYDSVRAVAGEPPFTTKGEREKHATEARFACYQAFCDSIPEGAAPPPVRAPEPTRPTVARVRKPEPTELRAPICPSCFLEMPLMGGACPNCD